MIATVGFKGSAVASCRREVPTETMALADRCRIARAKADRSHIALGV
jgi:hypothetical protein